MALSQSVLSELLDALRAGGGVDLVRDAVRLVMQELIEVEVTERIGADRYERSGARIAERNGSRQRLLATPAGVIELNSHWVLRLDILPEVSFESRRRFSILSGSDLASLVPPVQAIC